MGFNEFAAKAVRKVGHSASKKLRRKGATVEANPLPKAKPVKLSGKRYVCGYAVREVMPADIHAKKYWVAGHGMGHVMERVHDPITVSAMWVGADEAGGYVHISADIIGLTNHEVNQVRTSLADFIAASRCAGVFISCTHTHGGFDTVGYWGQLTKLQTGKDPDYMRQLLKAMEDVAREAYDNRKPGKLFHGTSHVPQAQYDKREPIVLHDVLTRFRFVPEDSGDEIWFLNYAAHPNTLGGSNRDCSADYPYWLRKTIVDARPSVHVLFGVGAIGAVDPGFESEDNLPLRAQKEGECLGEAALAIDNDEELEPKITVLQHPFYAPVDNGLLALMATIHVVSSQRYAGGKGELGLSLLSEMDYVSLGRQRILMLPGEPFPEVVYGGAAPADKSATGKGVDVNPKPLIELAGDPDLLVYGVSNDMTGYVVPPNDFILHKTQPYIEQGRDVFDRRHYHETNSLGYLTNETYAEVVSAIMKELS